MNTRIVLTAGAARGLVTKSCDTGWAYLNKGRASAMPVALGMALATAFSSMAHAADSETVTGGLDPATMLVNVCQFILGAFGQSLGVLGIIGIGLAWMFGRASLGLVAGVIGGIVIMFGAGYLGVTLMGPAATAG